MFARSVALILMLSIFGITQSAVAAETASNNKSVGQTRSGHKGTSRSHQAKKRHHYRHTLGFVPPPPAYVPSILPELYLHTETAAADDDDTAAAVVEKPVNPYAKYFYTRSGETPKATTARSGVTTWTTLH